MESLAELLEEQIKDLYSAESQLVKALPKIAKAATTPELKQAVEDHLAETRTHVQRLEQAAEQLDIKPTGKVCHGMKGLIEEGKEATEEDGDGAVIDGALIAAAQRVEHYEISGYGTARTLARLLGHKDIAALFDQTLEEESAADEKLTQVAEQAVYPAARQDEDGESEESDGELEKSVSSARRSHGQNGRHSKKMSRR